jgi:Fur family ferric uptake transcriptional regulator
MTKDARSRPGVNARALLAAKGLRVTERRLSVLEALARQSVPVTFPDLYEQLEGTGLDRATVYRNLVGMTGVGILVRSQLADGVARYELPAGESTGHGEHPHLVCVDCGQVTCLPPGSVSLHGEARRHVTEIQLRGHCAVCAG